MHSANEQFISQLVNALYAVDKSLDISRATDIISLVVSKYHVQEIELDEVHPDIFDKIELFLSAKQLEGVSKTTLGNYRLHLTIFAEHVKKRVTDITTADIRLYLSQFNHQKISTISTKLSIVKSFFSWLTAEEIIPRDPSAKIKHPKKEKRIPNALSIEQLELLRENCKTIRQRSLLEVLYSTGCRLSEVSNLNISDINFQRMSCRVIGKGNKERETFLSFKALYYLKKYLKERTDNCEALFVTQRSPYKRLSKRGIQREIEQISIQAGLDDRVTVHDLRRTFATLTLNNGADIVAVQELLGHESPDTTLLYARITEERKREQHRKYLVQ